MSYTSKTGLLKHKLEDKLKKAEIRIIQLERENKALNMVIEIVRRTRNHE